MSRQTARKALERRIKQGCPWVGPAPDTLKLSEIETLEGVFQFRDPLPYKSEAHKSRLGRSVKRTGGALKRLMVYWVGDGWVCIEGHHRLAAYHRTGLHETPVEVFAGPLKDAVALALTANSEDKLSMEDREHTAAAWDLVTTWNEEFSKSEIANKAGVSESTVGNMRHVRFLLEQRPHLKDLSVFSWRQARELAKGNEVEATTGSREAQVRRMADAFLKTFGVGGLGRDAPLTWDALKEYDPDLPDAFRTCIEDDEAAEANGETEGAPAEHRLPFPETVKEAQAGDF